MGELWYMGLGEPHVDGDARGPRCDISGEPSLESSRDTFLDSRDTFSECSRSPGKITAVASLHSASSASRCLSASVISAAIRGVRLAGLGEPRVIIYERRQRPHVIITPWAATGAPGQMLIGTVAHTQHTATNANPQHRDKLLGGILRWGLLVFAAPSSPSVIQSVLYCVRQASLQVRRNAPSS